MPADLQLVVTRHEPLAEGIAGLWLRRRDGAPLPPWEPGAHIDLRLPGGLIRQYSLCGDVADRSTWRLGVLREPDSRGGSRAIHDQLTTGSLVEATGPRNNFPLLASQNYLFLAGGIGITPILPMVREAAASGARWRLHYGGRSRRSMALREEVADLGPRATIHPQDEAGLLPLADLLTPPAPRTLVYCCGPAPLLAAVEELCSTWPAGSLHVERFAAPAPQRDDADGGAFEVELARSGTRLAVAADESLLEVLEAAGLQVPSSCREGICGTCEVGVLGGEIDHRDLVLTASERAANNTMFACVSRARGGKLVLDL